MRVGSGRLRGRTLRAPAGAKTRPTSGRLKKALFDILAGRLPDARFLDLYAGAGAVGIEALSRGASTVTFVEQDRRAAAAIEKNLEALGLSDRAALVRREVGAALGALASEDQRFDVVFLDPPYRAGGHGRLLSRLGSLDLLDPGGLLILEHHHKTALEEVYGSLTRIRQVRAGESVLSFYRKEAV